MEKSVGIVVVTYNRLELLKEVVESLRNQTYNDFQIVVVNNGSTDNTLQWLGKQTDIVTITQGNLGGAGGFHTGLKYVAEHGFKYCWLMDDDVVCFETALEELVKAYNINANIGFVCSAVQGLDGSPMNVPVVDMRASSNGYPNYYGLLEYQMIKVQNATFVSVFLATDMIKEVGLPYKDYFIWGDGTEYTMRISKRYPCYLACKSEVVHKRKIQGIIAFDTETDKKRLKNYFYFFRNSINNVKLYERFRNLMICYLKHSIKALIYFIQFDFRRYWVLTRAMFSAMFFKPKVEYPNNKQF